MTEYMYRFYSRRINPAWYQAQKIQVLYGTLNRMKALHRARVSSDWGKSNFDSIKIERAELGPWEEITEQF